LQLPAAAIPAASHPTASQPPLPFFGEAIEGNATATRVSQLPAAIVPASHPTTIASMPPQPAVSEEVIGSAAIDSQLPTITESNLQMFLKVFFITDTVNVLIFCPWFC
jgi:hypothetical protein